MSHADRGFDAGTQTQRWRFPRQSLAHQTSEGLDALVFGCERRIARQACLHAERIGRVKFAVHIGVDSQRGIFEASGTHHDDFLAMVFIIRVRPRASRDITVPIGTPVTCDISRYPSPWTSR